MSKVKIIKKNDEYSLEYNIGDICEVTGTWYGGVHITGKSGIPVSLDKEEYMELSTDMKGSLSYHCCRGVLILHGNLMRD